MPELNADTVLQLAPSLTIEAGETTMIRVGEKMIAATPDVFAILGVFTHPISYSSAVERLSSGVTGTQAWIELVSNIRTLHHAGVLIGESEVRPAAAFGYSAPQIHIAMLADQARTCAFISAIKKTVTPQDVVVDIGTGTGVLAVAAAQTGARHVYAIESSEIWRAAQQVFDANGFTDRITLIQGKSVNVELPEKATVLVAELIGNDALEERVLEVFADARKRFLVPQARLIPERVRVFGVPVTADRETLDTYTFNELALADWKKLYGVDFSSLPRALGGKPIVMSKLPQQIRNWPRLAKPVLLADVDLSGKIPPVIQQSAEVLIDENGEFNGFVVYFDLDVGAGERISTSPELATESNHWAVPIWLLRERRQVRPGDRFKVSYRYRVDSAGTNIDIEPA
jgi:hypothetical protein